MLTRIEGLHHVTALASDARRNNAFFVNLLGLRRVKTTVNFDAPDVYHLYYGDEMGRPGTVMTYFPFPNAARGRPGAGEASVTAFSVQVGALEFWSERLQAADVPILGAGERFGEQRLHFTGPDGEQLALVEDDADTRMPWTGGGIPEDVAIRGFHSVSLRLHDATPEAELLRFMGYAPTDSTEELRRFAISDSNGAGIVDIETVPAANPSGQGAGSVHHIAFAVPDRAAQVAVREALLEADVSVTPVIDRNYFWSIYFRTLGGVLFEIATDEPGFDSDEAPEELGLSLKLPSQHEHLRARLEQTLPRLPA